MRIQSAATHRLTVIHAVPRWLPLTENWIYTQVRSLPRGIESHVVCETTEHLEQFALPNVHSFLEAPRWRQAWDRGLRRLGLRQHRGFLASQARRYEAQILHSHFGNVGWANIGAARAVELRHVVSFYGFDVNYLPRQDPAWRLRYRALFECADRILCEGPHMAACLRSLGCPEPNIRVHHVGVRMDELPFMPRVWDPGEPLRVLVAASFQEKKGIPYTLEALGRLQHNVPLAMTIIGDANGEPRSQAEKARILEAIEKRNLQAHVRMLGYQSHAALLREAYQHHVFLSPSVTASDGDTEGGAPVTLIEMAATGMPVVSTTHCDIPEVIRHGVTGLLARERDVEGLVSQLIWLIQNPDRWGPFVERCRRYLEAEYDARKQGERLAEIYREIVTP